MIRIAARDRVWVIGAAITIVALLVAGWFFLIGPKLDESTTLDSQASDARSRVALLQRRLADLKKQNADLDKYRARLATDRQALPTTAASSDFLRELQSVGDRTGVSISGITLSAPIQVPGDTSVRALPIVLTANGDVARLNEFLDQLQQVQPRAVLINTVNLTPGDQKKAAGAYILSVSLHAFVANPLTGGAGGVAPTPSD